jgi:hypothetical protein
MNISRRQLSASLRWTYRGDTFGGHHEFEAKAARGRYAVGPTFIGPGFESANYHVVYYVGKKSHLVADGLPTAEQAKAVAEADHARSAKRRRSGAAHA